MVINTAMTRKSPKSIQKLSKEKVLQYTVNIWGMECLINSFIKNTVSNTEESFKSGIPKIERKIDITFDFLALKKGPHCQGQSEESKRGGGLAFLCAKSCNNKLSLVAYSLNFAGVKVSEDLYILTQYQRHSCMDTTTKPYQRQVVLTSDTCLDSGIDFPIEP